MKIYLNRYIEAGRLSEKAVIEVLARRSTSPIDPKDSLIVIIGTLVQVITRYNNIPQSILANRLGD